MQEAAAGAGNPQAKANGSSMHCTMPSFTQAMMGNLNLDEIQKVNLSNSVVDVSELSRAGEKAQQSNSPPFLAPAGFGAPLLPEQLFFALSHRPPGRTSFHGGAQQVSDQQVVQLPAPRCPGPSELLSEASRCSRSI